MILSRVKSGRRGGNSGVVIVFVCSAFQSKISLADVLMGSLT